MSCRQCILCSSSKTGHTMGDTRLTRREARQQARWSLGRRYLKMDELTLYFIFMMIPFPNTFQMGHFSRRFDEESQSLNNHFPDKKKNITHSKNLLVPIPINPSPYRSKTRPFAVKELPSSSLSENSLSFFLFNFDIYLYRLH